MKTNVCKIALMFLIGTALSLLFNSCSKDPVIPENETDNKLHEDPSKMTIRLVECHLHADWNEIQKVGGPHQNPESPAKHMKRIQEITYELKAGKGWRLAEGSQSKFLRAEKWRLLYLWEIHPGSRLFDVHLLL